MQNSRDLRNSLSAVIEGLTDKSIEPKIAKEVINATGKIIQSLGVELKHDMYHKVLDQIDFLSKPEKPKSLKALDEN